MNIHVLVGDVPVDALPVDNIPPEYQWTMYQLAINYQEMYCLLTNEDSIISK